MLVYIYACEGTYGGMHGMYEECIENVENIDAANWLGKQMAKNVIDSYDCFDEDDFETELEWHIYKIRDEFSYNDIKDEIVSWDKDDFVKKFCESEVLN